MLASGLTGLYSVAAAGGYVYFTREGSAGVGDGAVGKVNANSGAVTVLASAQLNARGLALDSAYAYWTNYSNSSGKVQRIAQTGGAPELLKSPETPLGIATDGIYVFYSKYAKGEVRRMAVNGTNDNQLTGAAGYPDGVATDGAYVYFADELPGAIKKVAATGGGGVTTFANTESSSAVAVDSTHIYFNDGSKGTVNRMPKSSISVPQVLASGQTNPSRMWLDGATLYWVNQHTSAGAVLSIPVTGGPSKTLASAQPAPFSVTVDTSAIYWANHGNGTLMKLAK